MPYQWVRLNIAAMKTATTSPAITTSTVAGAAVLFLALWGYTSSALGAFVLSIVLAYPFGLVWGAGALLLAGAGRAVNRLRSPS